MLLKLPTNTYHFIFTLFNRQRFSDICEDRINRGGITVMKDVSLAKRNQETISKEYSIYKIQDILWDDVFEQYFLHPTVILFIILEKNNLNYN